MKRIFWFNPENDQALGTSGSYTPSSGAQRMRSVGCGVWAWRADDNDAILVSDEKEAAFARQALAKADCKATIVDHVPEGFTPIPWGWSTYAYNHFLKAGTSPALMPTPCGLDAMRQLSHRRTTIHYHHLLGTSPDLIPIEVTSASEAMTIISKWDGAVVKLPWSCSGRGVLFSDEIPPTVLNGYINGIIRRQGSAIIEPMFHKKIHDFALLMEVSANGEVKYLGPSLFITDHHGNYGGNIVAPSSEIESMIGVELKPIIERAITTLTSIITPAGYFGPIGIDMMTWQAPDGNINIAECIEINFRHTMGFIARDMEQKGLHGMVRINPVAGVELRPLPSN